MNSVETELEKALDNVLVPGTMRSIVRMNLVRSTEVTDGKAKLMLASAGIPAERLSWLKDKASAAVSEVSGVNEVTVDFVEIKPKELNQIDKIIAVMSGKGGVGKSLVAGLLATAFAREGKDVGILDADITGPSIPKMFGLTARPSGNEIGILPITSASGIEIMSLTEMIVKKAVRMAQRMNVRVLGVVENMSYLLLPDTGKKMEVFGKSRGEEMARASGSTLLGRLPIDPQLAKLCDEGKIERYSSDAVSELFANVVAALNRETAI